VWWSRKDRRANKVSGMNDKGRAEGGAKRNGARDALTIRRAL
jgi:hypothetical protein